MEKNNQIDNQNEILYKLQKYQTKLENTSEIDLERIKLYQLKYNYYLEQWGGVKIESFKINIYDEIYENILYLNRENINQNLRETIMIENKIKNKYDPRIYYHMAKYKLNNVTDNCNKLSTYKVDIIKLKENINNNKIINMTINKKEKRNVFK